MFTMACSTLFHLYLLISLVDHCRCIAEPNEVGLGQGGDGNLASYLMLKIVSGLETDIRDLKAEVANKKELKAEVKELQDELHALRAAVANHTKAFQADVAEIQKLKADVADIDKVNDELADLKSKYIKCMSSKFKRGKYFSRLTTVSSTDKLEQPRTIFAQMQLLGTHVFKAGNRVYFTTPVANVGDAYDTQHGYFEAPCYGTYLFSVTLCTDSNNWVVFRIIQDGKVLGEGHPGDSSWHACASSTVVTLMERGSQVWVDISRIAKGTLASEAGIPSFTGVFLNNYLTP